MNSIGWLGTPARVAVGGLLRVLAALAAEIGPEKIADVVVNLNLPPAVVAFLAWAAELTSNQIDDAVMDHVSDILESS